MRRGSFLRRACEFLLCRVVATFPFPTCTWTDASVASLGARLRRSASSSTCTPSRVVVQASGGDGCASWSRPRRRTWSAKRRVEWFVDVNSTVHDFLSFVGSACGDAGAKEMAMVYYVRDLFVRCDTTQRRWPSVCTVIFLVFRPGGTVVDGFTPAVDTAWLVRALFCRTWPFDSRT